MKRAMCNCAYIYYLEFATPKDNTLTIRQCRIVYLQYNRELSNTQLNDHTISCKWFIQFNLCRSLQRQCDKISIPTTGWNIVLVLAQLKQ